LVGERLEATHYHGLDGLGDAGTTMDVSMDQLQKEHAVPALIRIVNKYPGNWYTNVHMNPRQKNK